MHAPRAPDFYVISKAIRKILGDSSETLALIAAQDSCSRSHSQQRRLQRNFHRAQTFPPLSQFFLRDWRNCAPTHSLAHFTRPEAHMQRRPFAQSLVSTISVVLATIMLAACGPGDSASSQAAAANAQARSDDAAHAPDSTAPLPRASLPQASASTDNVANGIGTSAQNAASAADATRFASNAVESVQASLAADSQQVAPIMSYAPGEGSPPTRTGNDSSSTATTSQ